AATCAPGRGTQPVRGCRLGSRRASTLPQKQINRLISIQGRRRSMAARWTPVTTPLHSCAMPTPRNPTLNNLARLATRGAVETLAAVHAFRAGALGFDRPSVTRQTLK